MCKEEISRHDIPLRITAIPAKKSNEDRKIDWPSGDKLDLTSLHEYTKLSTQLVEDGLPPEPGGSAILSATEFLLDFVN